MPRLSITFSDEQLEALDRASGEMGRSAFIRQILADNVPGFPSGDVQHGGYRLKHGYKFEVKTVRAANSKQFQRISNEMMGEHWRRCSEFTIDPDTGEISAEFERIVPDED